MKVAFPREEIPPHLVESRYKMAMDMHMHYDKMHTQQELAYIKYAGFFILAFLGFMLVEGKGLISDYLIAVVCTGFGVLFTSVMNALFISSEIEQNRAIYEEEGKSLEEKYPSIINFHYFRMMSNLNASRYRAALFSRLLPFVFVGSLTIWSAVTLSLKTSSTLAIVVGVASSVALAITVSFVARNIKKHQKNRGIGIQRTISGSDN